MNARHSHHQILNQKCDQVRNLVSAARRLQALTEALRTSLPIDERAHLRALTVTGSGGTLWVDSPAWATRFRYSVPEFLNSLRKLPGAENITTLQIKILPREMLAVPEALPLRPLSAEAEQIISACAVHIEDPLLRAALQRLATNTTSGRRKPIPDNHR